MKVLAFCASEEDRMLYNRFSKEEVEITAVPHALAPDCAGEVKGYDAVIILTRCVIDSRMAEILKQHGVRYIALKSAGYDHVDLRALAGCGIKAANVPYYSPNAVAEHTLMTTLMCLRHMRRQMDMVGHGDYTLSGIRGRELGSLVVGIIGTGRIGRESLKLFSAFGGRIMMHSRSRRRELEQYGTYEDLDVLYGASDILVFHCPLTEDTRQMVNRRSLSGMKDGVILINPARGQLFAWQDVLAGLESGKIGALAFDSYDNEKAYIRRTIPGGYREDSLFERLVSMEQVVYTAHTAFYTDKAAENMAEVTVENLQEYAKTGACRNELTGGVR